MVHKINIVGHNQHAKIKQNKNRNKWSGIDNIILVIKGSFVLLNLCFNYTYTCMCVPSVKVKCKGFVLFLFFCIGYQSKV